MKKTLFWCMALVAMLMVNCSKEDDNLLPPQKPDVEDQDKDNPESEDPETEDPETEDPEKDDPKDKRVSLQAFLKKGTTRAAVEEDGTMFWTAEDLLLVLLDDKLKVMEIEDGVGESTARFVLPDTVGKLGKVAAVDHTALQQIKKDGEVIFTLPDSYELTSDDVCARFPNATDKKVVDDNLPRAGVLTSDASGNRVDLYPLTGLVAVELSGLSQERYTGSMAAQSESITGYFHADFSQKTPYLQPDKLMGTLGNHIKVDFNNDKGLESALIYFPLPVGHYEELSISFERAESLLGTVFSHVFTELDVKAGDIISLHADSNPELPEFSFKETGTNRHSIEWSGFEGGQISVVYSSEVDLHCVLYANGERVVGMDRPKGVDQVGGFRIFVNETDEPIVHELKFNDAATNVELGVFTVYQGKGVSGDLNITIDGKTGDTGYAVYTWFGHEVELPLDVTPAIPFKYLQEAFLEKESEGLYRYESMVLKMTDDRAVVYAETQENTTRNSYTYKLQQPAKPENYATGSVYFKSVAWICNMNAGEYETLKPLTYTEGGRNNWSYTWNQDVSERYFKMFYGKNQEEYDLDDNAVAHLYINDSYVPTQEYTLIVDKPDEILVEKVDDEVYRMKRLKPDSFAEVVLTYRCGKYEQNYKLYLLPS